VAYCTLYPVDYEVKVRTVPVLVPGTVPGGSLGLRTNFPMCQVPHRESTTAPDPVDYVVLPTAVETYNVSYLSLRAY
jgi:hypothetical protein